jgi:hypothetical protein
LTTPQNWQKDHTGRYSLPQKLMDEVTIWVKMYIHTTTTTTHGMDHGLLSSRIFFGHQKIATLLRGYQECSWKFCSLHSREEGMKSVHWKFDHFCEYGLEGLSWFTILLAALEGTISLIQLSFSWIY